VKPVRKKPLSPETARVLYELTQDCLRLIEGKRGVSQACEKVYEVLRKYLEKYKKIMDKGAQ
jgi:hypothetical protein